MSFRSEDLDVDEILKERSQRYCIESSIFEDGAGGNDGNGEMCPTENGEVGGVLKLVPNAQGIDFKRSGLDILNPSLAGTIFDDAKLHKNLCESKPKNMINHPLFHMSSSDLHDVILRGLLKQQMKNQVIYSHLNKYMFFLISCQCSESLVNACCDTLIYQFLTSSAEKNGCPHWIPSVEDMTMVLCNYGAPRELLYSWDTPLPKRDSSSGAVSDLTPPALIKVKNIVWILKVISALLVHYKSACYSINELDHLLCMILTMSLDKYVVKMQSVRLNLEFSKCVKSILSAYPASEWQERGKVSSLSRALYYKLKDVFISDVYFLINNYVACPGFGQKLALSLMHVFIKGTVWSSDPITHLDDVEVKHVRKIFKVDSLMELDYHTQYYVLLMVENVVTNLIYTSRDLVELNRIRHLLSNLRIKSPHCEDMVDFLLVKELITRAATTWKLSLTELT